MIDWDFNEILNRQSLRNIPPPQNLMTSLSPQQHLKGNQHPLDAYRMYRDGEVVWFGMVWEVRDTRLLWSYCHIICPYLPHSVGMMLQIPVDVTCRLQLELFGLVSSSWICCNIHQIPSVLPTLQIAAKGTNIYAVQMNTHGPSSMS